MTDLLSQIEAAAAHRGNIHEKCATCDGKEIIYSNDSTGRSWKCPTCFGTGVVRKVPDLPLSAIAEKLRAARAAREAAERERDRIAAKCESLRAVVERMRQLFPAAAESARTASRLCYPFAVDTCNNPACSCRDEKRAAEAARLAGKPSGGGGAT